MSGPIAIVLSLGHAAWFHQATSICIGTHFAKGSRKTVVWIWLEHLPIMLWQTRFAEDNDAW
jgi:hypothetical protein